MMQGVVAKCADIDAMVCLGIPMGFEGAVKRLTAELVTKSEERLPALAKFKSVHTRHRVFKVTFGGMIIHLIRAIDPRIIGDLVDGYRKSMAEAYLRYVLQLPEWKLQTGVSNEDDIHHVIRLMEAPVVRSGLGFPNLSECARITLHLGAHANAQYGLPGLRDEDRVDYTRWCLKGGGFDVERMVVTPEQRADRELSDELAFDREGERATGVAHAVDKDFWYVGGERPPGVEGRLLTWVPRCILLGNDEFLLDLAGHRKLMRNIKEAGWESQDMDEQRYAHNHSIFYAIASSNGLGTYGKPIYTARHFLKTLYGKPFANADFVATMRTFLGFPARIAPLNPDGSSTLEVCSNSACGALAHRMSVIHQMVCKQGSLDKVRLHNATTRLLGEILRSEESVTGVLFEPQYRELVGNRNRADLFVRSTDGGGIYLDITILDTANRIVNSRSSPAAASDLVKAGGVQRLLKRLGWDAKGDKYAGCLERYNIAGNNDGPVEEYGTTRKVADMVPIVFDSTGTIYEWSAAWLQGFMSPSKWARFKREASFIFAKYYGRRMRQVPQAWFRRSKAASKSRASLLSSNDSDSVNGSQANCFAWVADGHLAPSASS
jgi:hypothetical protein